MHAYVVRGKRYYVNMQCQQIADLCKVLEDVKARYLQRDWKPDCYPGQHLGWAKHLVSWIIIIRSSTDLQHYKQTAAKLLLSKAGPQHFSKGMGVQLLLGTIPRLVRRDAHDQEEQTITNIPSRYGAASEKDESVS